MSIESNLKNTVVIGGGIVGICCALYLQKKVLKSLLLTHPKLVKAPRSGAVDRWP